MNWMLYRFCFTYDRPYFSDNIYKKICTCIAYKPDLYSYIHSHIGQYME